MPSAIGSHRIPADQSMPTCFMHTKFAPQCHTGHRFTVCLGELNYFPAIGGNGEEQVSAIIRVQRALAHVVIHRAGAQTLFLR